VSHAQTSERLLRETIDRDLSLYALATIARVHQKVGDYERAERNFLELLDSAFEGERVSAVGNVLMELALLYEDAEKQEQAANCYRTARTIGLELPSRMQVKARQAERRFRLRHTSEAVDQILRQPSVDWRENVRTLLSGRVLTEGRSSVN
jgi:tetratricopeptide (TPR) repeat protein